METKTQSEDKTREAERKRAGRREAEEGESTEQEKRPGVGGREEGKEERK